MDYQEAIDYLEKFKKALSKVEHEASYYQNSLKRINAYEVKIKNLTTEINELKLYKIHFEKLSKASDFQVCQNCNGAGGGYVEMGNQGGEGWSCNICDGLGILKKQI